MINYEYGEFDVSVDRDKYIGGSDIPAVLGISKFTTRWQLLLQKAGLEDRGFSGNRYTEYGHIIEPQIRGFINRTYNTNYQPCRVVNGDFRYHADGFNGITVLEIKSTSDIHATIDGYKAYLVQLLKGMQELGAGTGLLAVYDRPEDMNPVFEPRRLQLFEVYMDENTNLLDHINRELEKFRSDLAKLKENPLLSEQDFLPGGSLVVLADKVAQFETQLAQLKEIEAKCKEAKKQLYNEMVKHNINNWTMPNGTKITKVAEVPAGVKTVNEFDEAAFKSENPELYARFVRQTEKKTNGKSGYVLITVPK